MNVFGTTRLERRAFLGRAAAGMLGALGLRSAASAEPAGGSRPSHTHGAPASDAPGVFVPVQTPDVARLPCEMDGGVKVFRLVAEPVKQELVPGRVLDLWGYNGGAPGPTIEAHEGDRVRILFENRLPEATTVHWHGLEVPIEMDGTPAISQPPVEPGGRFTYEFTLRQHGTYFYHSHGAMQEMMGMLGFFIIHPRQAYAPHVDKDFGIILQEYAVLPNNTIPNSLSMEFNWLTFNGKAGPAATPLIVKLGERVRIRLVNLGMDHHPIHLHGNSFHVTGTEAGRIPESARFAENTVLVGVAQARTIEFEARFPGDWMLHCHLPHHMMNQMVSMVGPLAAAGHGVRAGGGMEEGMGLVRNGLRELGPTLGRGLGFGATAERAVSALVGQEAPATQHGHGGHGDGAGTEAGTRVPGFPQDMMMPMDDAVAKPETYGLAEGWTGATQGMMTLVRVLPPDRYEDVMRRVRERDARPQPTPTPPAPREHGAGGHRH